MTPTPISTVLIRTVVRVERVICEGRGRDRSDDVTSPGVPRATRKLDKTRNDSPWSRTRKETLALELQLPEL